MSLPSDAQLKEWIIKYSKSYIADNIEGALHAQKRFFYQVNEIIYPYTDAQVDVAVGILKARLEGRQTVKPEDRKTIFISGPIGAFHLSEKEPEKFPLIGQFLRDNNAVVISFPANKKVFAASPLFDFYDGTNYNLIRPLMSAIDVTARKELTDYNIAADNTLAPTDPTRQAKLEELRVDAEANNIVNLGIALTPQESTELQLLANDMSELTAESAAAYVRNFRLLNEVTTDFILYNYNGDLLFYKVNGEIKTLDEEKIGAWQKACGAQTETYKKYGQGQERLNAAISAGVPYLSGSIVPPSDEEIDEARANPGGWYKDSGGAQR